MDLETLKSKIDASEFTKEELDELYPLIDNQHGAIKNAIEGTSNLDNVLVDLIDDVGKGATDKFDDVLKKIDAGEFSEDELKKLLLKLNML